MIRLLATSAILVLAVLDSRPSAISVFSATPPLAKQIPHTRSIHGELFVDPYFWMKGKSNPGLLAYLQAENAYTEAVAKPLAPLRDKLYKEFVGRIQETDLSVPYTKRGYSYFLRTEEGKQYDIRLRKRLPDGNDEVLLDPNQMQGDSKFLAIGATAVSPDDQLLAYTEDRTGFREYSLFVKDLRTGKLISEKPIRKVSSVVWAADNKTLFYVTDDHVKRASKLFCHIVGSDQSDLVYEEKDPEFELGVAKTLDEKYIFAMSTSTTSTEERYIPADAPNAPWTVLLPRQPEHEYTADHRRGQFVIRTNKGAKNFRIVTAPVASPANWTDLVPHHPAILIEEFNLFDDFLVVTEREAGLQHLRIVDLNTGTSRRVDMPEAVCSITSAENPEFSSRKFRLHYQSLVTPETVYDLDLPGRKLTELKRTEVLGGYDPKNYRSEWIMATAADGAKVPISLVYKTTTPRDGTAPCFLTGYGAYGSSSAIAFSSEAVSLMDRGVVVATAHIRGGKEMGQIWHDQGRTLQKKNTFTDFIVCADHLVANKYCARNRLAINGASAGGLLIGAVVNMRPDLCKVAVLGVPFVDAVNTMLDPSIPLTIVEYQEWGNPRNKPDYDYMKTYCPYTNIAAKAYPSILVTSSVEDSQVMVHEPTKYVARLRSLKTDKNPLIFRCNMAGGHGGSSGRYDSLKESAFDMAFVLDQIGAAY